MRSQPFGDRRIRGDTGGDGHFLRAISAACVVRLSMHVWSGALSRIVLVEMDRAHAGPKIKSMSMPMSRELFSEEVPNCTLHSPHYSLTVPAEQEKSMLF